MTYDEAIAKIETEGYAVDLGQFDRSTRGKLDRAVKRGQIAKRIGYWPYFDFGTCYKTFFFRPDHPMLEAAE